MATLKEKTRTAEIATSNLLEKIKKTSITAMFSDDELLDLLVLKGGNAMDLVHEISSRSSADIDFSMEGDIDSGAIWPKLDRNIRSAFKAEGYHAFDIKISARPTKGLPEELSSFWGGYLVEFKLISSGRAEETGHDIEIMRREAVRLGEGSRFTIDISRYEYTKDKQQHVLDGYTIYVYSPEMIVCEKLRAICQQMPEYGPIILRTRPGNQRARDFVDIEVLVKEFGIDFSCERTRYLIEQMFSIKRVPLSLLKNICKTEDFHAQGYASVRATVKPGVVLEDFPYYFRFVVDCCNQLEPLWDV